MIPFFSSSSVHIIDTADWMSILQTRTPIEITQAIFSYIHPVSVFKFARLCKQIQICLEDPCFFKLSLQNYTTATDKTLASHYECFEYQKYEIKSNVRKAGDILFGMWFHWPPHIQEMFSKGYLSATKNIKLISWKYEFQKGTIPPALQFLKSLVHLDLSSNLLTGTLPEELASLFRLKTINLSKNLLTGSIPASWGEGLAKLEKLDVSHNQLSGHVPTKELSKLKHLKQLYLNDNRRLGGCFEGSWETLEIVKLDGTRIQAKPFERVWVMTWKQKVLSGMVRSDGRTCKGQPIICNTQLTTSKLYEIEYERLKSSDRH